MNYAPREKEDACPYLQKTVMQGKPKITGGNTFGL